MDTVDMALNNHGGQDSRQRHQPKPATKQSIIMLMRALRSAHTHTHTHGKKKGQIIKSSYNNNVVFGLPAELFGLRITIIEYSLYN
jgi:hypothetical protein